jgi:dTMP kinase
VEEIARLSEWATGGLEPDLVIVLDVGSVDAAARRAGPQDRMEREPDSFRAAVNEAYRDLAGRFGWTLLDGSSPVEVVAEQVWAAVRPLV